MRDRPKSYGRRYTRRSKHRLASALTLSLLLLATLAGGCSLTGTADQAASQVEEQAEEAKEAVEGASQEIKSGTTPATPATSATSGGSAKTVTVARTVDGDTLELANPVKGRTTLRLVGIDTPESAIPGEEPQPLGNEAAAFTERRLEGKQVKLSIAPDSVDPYDRLLGNVRLPGDPRLHAEAVLDEGLGQTLFYDPNTQPRDKFTAIQETARQRGAGIWGLSQAKKCLLTDRGNGLGAGSAGC